MLLLKYKNTNQTEVVDIHYPFGKAPYWKEDSALILEARDPNLPIRCELRRIESDDK